MSLVALPSSLRGSEVEVRPGRRLSVAVDGSADAARVVFFCHGAGGSKAQWRSVWDAVAAPDVRRVAWDFPGHGVSGDPRGTAPYRGEEMLQDWLALFDAHGAGAGGQTVVVGHSYGTRTTLAGLSTLQAQWRLGEVAGALLLGPPPPQVSFGGGPLATWPLPLLWLMRPKLSADFAKAAWSPTADPALVSREQDATRRNRLSMMRALMGGGLMLDPEVLDRLDLPVRLIAGADDKLTPPVAAEMLAAALPHAGVEVLPACGHQIMLEKPQAVIDEIQALFEPGV